MNENIRTQVFVDLTAMDTVMDVLKSLTMTAYHHGNWQKDFGPENLIAFEKRIMEITAHQLPPNNQNLSKGEV